MRVSFDIGGTFTDIVLLDENTGRTWLGKALTTYNDFSQAIATGISQVLGDADRDTDAIDSAVVGATTLVTNALIERRGATTALVTTEGFGDVLEIGREWRYDLYDPRLQLPDPLVDPEARYEATERLDATGAVVTPLDRAGVERIADQLAAAGVESVAVCLLHSYVSAAHEEEIAEILQARLPEVPVTLSGHLVPVIREYERTVTTLANAYVRPVAGEHFEDIERALVQLGIDQQLMLMQSNGGVVSTATARAYPIRLLESGPAAGAIGAAYVGRQLDIENLIAFDMGGTTAKVCIVEGGAPTVRNGFEVGRVHRLKSGSGLPVSMPVVDMIEIGAGGGSIAHLDGLGLLKVGPKSAGSRPGPAGYGLGGTEPTVTDADIVLGYLDPAYFLGGRMSLDVEASRRAMVDSLGTAFGDDPVAAAAGIARVVDEHMALAVQVHLTEHGHDPRTFPMVAFGGAAPVHAARIARILGVGRLIIPAAAGVLSATGLLVAAPMVEESRTRLRELRDWDSDDIEAIFADLVAQARHELGTDIDRVDRFVEMRFLGQGFEIEVPVAAGDGPDEYRAKFVAEYEHIYGTTPDYERIEIVTWRVRVYGPFEAPDLTRTVSRDAAEDTTRTRAAWWPETGLVEAPVRRMLALPVGERVVGPAILQLPESTAVVGPLDEAWLDEFGNLHVDIATGSAS
ncbi:hydantoinase/oxoprolinase family protein [Homoserinibacter sp. GY 40078]|uniref:hydantoinase/oxoprolinase family protein n=1 Tax=Homoserinibacter sp. GY 40078 TaxID=2603275 RepID=UPI0011CA98BE|nr:hydantoinase/oxoprolinase family protein [Homoserinibacter sp. GY 40078]TXK19293.1 hydantoinase/oxoprolinase family protein [Homoserinibacter sp. GY 40078]